MKKLLALVLTAFLCLWCLASCQGSYSANEFFSEDLLSEYKLADMPVPPHMDNSVMRADKFLYLNLTKSEYEQYVNDLLEYLRTKEDIYYLGYSIGKWLLAEMMPYHEIAPITDSYNTSDDSHDIFFSIENSLGNNDFLGTPIKIRIVRSSGKLNFNDYEYNTLICIYDGYSAAASWNLCGAEHTYDEGVEYKIAGSDRTIAEYTCVNCGSTKISDFIGDMNFYKITIEDIDNCLIDHPTEGISGTIYRIKTKKIIDADLKFVANGTRIYPRETDDDKWIYEFVMPCEDVVITAEIVSDTADQDGSNDIFYSAAYPEEFDYNGRRYLLVQGDGVKSTATQEELGELLGYIIREEDVPKFTKEYPNIGYVIDNGIYDYETNSRVAFYSLKAHPDLSVICMNQCGVYVLFQCAD